MQRICLNMIVKNESDIIVETLDNIRSQVEIEHFVICDTGSTDDTIATLTAYFKQHQLQADIYQHQWVDFAHNRNLALQQCEGKGEYVLFFDADDRFHGELLLPDQLRADIYHLKFKSESDDASFYSRGSLVKINSVVWVGVLHESIVPLSSSCHEEYIEGDYFIQTGHFGDRSKNPDKYLNDAQVLEKAFAVETTQLKLKARYAYYCATSYYSHGDQAKAIEWFKKRIEISNYTDDHDESFLAYKYLGMIYVEVGESAKACDIWLKAWSQYPNRLECLYEASILYAQQGYNRLAHDIAYLGVNVSFDYSHSFYNENIYRYGIHYQISQYGRLCGELEHAYQAVIKLIEAPFYSDALVKHIVESLLALKHYILTDTAEQQEKIYHYVERYAGQYLAQQQTILSFFPHLQCA